MTDRITVDFSGIRADVTKKAHPTRPRSGRERSKRNPIAKLIFFACLGPCLLLCSSSPIRLEGSETRPLSNQVQDEPNRGIGIERVFPRLRFDRPVFLSGAGDESGRIFVVEQAGVIRVFSKQEHLESASAPTDDAPQSKIFLDIRDRISRAGNEEGLIGMAFHPQFKTNGQFFVHYSSSVNDKHGIIARYQVSDNDPDQADPESEKILMEIDQPYRNHNGGSIAFGNDRFLYISLGDGGSANDPQGNGQNLNTWLGSILRIDVDHQDEGKAYAVPKDNPFVDTPDARPEIWALGMRNAWRISFDHTTGDLWAADVGQNKWEEISIITRGGNYGWNRYEANNDFNRDTPLIGEHTLPVATYGREWGISITGGYVYRGNDFPEMQGSYFYGDYFSGNLWKIDREPDGKFSNELVRRTGRSISSFGEDDDRELYLLSFDGGIYRIVPTAEPENTFANWPAKLSETDYFASLEDHEFDPRFVAYQVNAPFWSDGADKTRFLAIPDGKTIGYRDGGAWEMPVGTTLIKSFTGQHLRDANRKLETRVIRRTDEGWEAATYVWDSDGKDGQLMTGGQQFELYQRHPTKRAWQVNSWHAPSASECASCHTDAAGYVLGITTAQINLDTADDGNQITEWAKRGILKLPNDFDLESAVRFCSPRSTETSEDITLETRARVWLDVNCAMCHRPDGPGNANIDLRFATSLDQTRLINEKPAQGNLGISEARIIAPGNPKASLLLHRVETQGAGRMPNIGTNQIDSAGVDLLRQWISEMTAEQSTEKRISAKIISANKIWDDAPHNAFTDLIRFEDQWYSVFREGKSHVSPDGALRVIRSSDGIQWESAALIESSNSDLRDAKITITPDHRLMLSGAESMHQPVDYKHQSLVWFSNDGSKWSESHEVGDRDNWLWRTTWHDSIAYGFGYGTLKDHRTITLYSSKNGKSFTPLVKDALTEGYPNETAMVFLEDKSCYCLLRRDGNPSTALLGSSRPPYTNWTWNDLGVKIGGPQMIEIPGFGLVAVVRLYDGGARTALCTIDPQTNEFNEILKLPSGGDTSYAGMAWHDDLLWVSYYSSHERKTSIYLAKIQLEKEPSK